MRVASLWNQNHEYVYYYLRQVLAVANRPARRNPAVDRAWWLLWNIAVHYRSSEVATTVSLLRFERPLCRAKSITSFDNRYVEVIFSKTGVWNKVPEGSTLIFGDTWISFEVTQCRKGEKKLSCQKNQLDSFGRFARTPTCDRRTQTDRHRAKASKPIRASIASRGKK